MRLLLDTDVLLWFLAGAGPLSAAQRTAIFDPASEVWVSMASLWEVVLRVRQGRLEANADAVLAAAVAAGFGLLPLRDAHLRALAGLPMLPGQHNPFGQMLIAQAMAEELVLATAAGEMSGYPVRILA